MNPHVYSQVGFVWKRLTTHGAFIGFFPRMYPPVLCISELRGERLTTLSAFKGFFPRMCPHVYSQFIRGVWGIEVASFVGTFMVFNHFIVLM